MWIVDITLFINNKYEDNIYEQRKEMPMEYLLYIIKDLFDTSLEKVAVNPRYLTKYIDDLFMILNKSN